jgi:hypothetical protein
MPRLAPVAVEMALLLLLSRGVSLALVLRHAETCTILCRGLLFPGTRLALALLSEIDDVTHLLPAA